jgi:hypothetical protein
MIDLLGRLGNNPMLDWRQLFNAQLRLSELEIEPCHSSRIIYRACRIPYGTLTANNTACCQNLRNPLSVRYYLRK